MSMMNSNRNRQANHNHYAPKGTGKVAARRNVRRREKHTWKKENDK